MKDTGWLQQEARESSWAEATHSLLPRISHLPPKSFKNLQWNYKVYKNTNPKKRNILTHSLLPQFSHLPSTIFRSPQSKHKYETKYKKPPYTPLPWIFRLPLSTYQCLFLKDFICGKYQNLWWIVRRSVMRSILGIVETFICFRKEYDDLYTYNAALNYKSFFSRNFSAFFCEAKKIIWLNGSDIEHVHPNLCL